MVTSSVDATASSTSAAAVSTSAAAASTSAAAVSTSAAAASTSKLGLLPDRCQSSGESLNRISKLLQTDLAIRFWDENKNEVPLRFWNSSLMGHLSASDMSGFKEGLGNEVEQGKVVQVSMDGRNSYQDSTSPEDLFQEQECTTARHVSVKKSAEILEDTLLLPKLHFFLTITSSFEPFLSEMLVENFHEESGSIEKRMQ
ncbi:hypothetical protein PR048_012441 [Dryococelus australis]|uniref:Uncharacterized protein n=1 Tax=Dryococelus australis TaxID=614101 RepID=A0ABQ9HPE8_9NEOP|nr:hypothetical protein PR048_012441 [Dryococelus australis]